MNKPPPSPTRATELGSSVTPCSEIGAHAEITLAAFAAGKAVANATNGTVRLARG